MIEKIGEKLQVIYLLGVWQATSMATTDNSRQICQWNEIFMNLEQPRHTWGWFCHLIQEQNHKEHTNNIFPKYKINEHPN